MSKKIWYAKMSGGGCQGIVIDEETGETVAVSYSPSNRHLIASAPDLQKSLRGIVSILEELHEKTVINMCDFPEYKDALSALAKSKGE